MKTIVVTSDKGGVGKSTITSLIIEWLNFNGKTSTLTDADPIQTSRTWADNCLADGRIVSSVGNADYHVVDTAGTSGAGLTWLQKADLIVAPFQPHYADIRTILEWFCSLNPKLQEKVVFIPNRYQKTKEQKEGLAQVEKVIIDEKKGSLITGLSNRPAIYGALLNGSAKNFFEIQADKTALEEADALVKIVMQYCNR